MIRRGNQSCSHQRDQRNRAPQPQQWRVHLHGVTLPGSLCLSIVNSSWSFALAITGAFDYEALRQILTLHKRIVCEQH